MTKKLIDEAVVRQALEYLQDNQHLIADNERHAYVMEYNAFIKRFEQTITLAEQSAPAHCEAGPEYCPECKTEAEKTAFAFGWYKALESVRKPWVGLTDEERLEVVGKKWWDWDDAVDIDGFIGAIEAKLKEKNT